MDSSIPILSLAAAGAVAATAMVAPRVKARLALSRAKHRSLGGHSKMSRRVAKLIPFYEFDDSDFFRSDGAPAEIATQRHDAFFRLAALYKERFAKSRQMTAEAGRDPAAMQIVMGAQPPDAALIGRYQALDVDIVYPSLPSEKEDTILPILDQWVGVMRQVTG